MRPSFLILTILFTLALLLQPGPTPTLTATSTIVAAATPLEAVETLLKPFYSQGASSSTCNALSGKFEGCPITARLLNRLKNATENGNIISRSQNPPQNITLSLVDNDGQTAHVNTTWHIGTGSYTITFVVVKVADGWQVDDSYCAGQPDTSIFSPPTGPCPADTGGSATPTPSATSAIPAGTATPSTNPTAASSPTFAAISTATAVVPGIPNTGSDHTLGFLIPALVLFALLAALIGVLISLRTRPTWR
jgi:hypothetical protein